MRPPGNGLGAEVFVLHPARGLVPGGLVAALITGTILDRGLLSRLVRARREDWVPEHPS